MCETPGPLEVKTVTIKFWPRGDASAMPVRKRECATLDDAISYWERNHYSSNFVGKVYDTGSDKLIRDLN